MTAARLGLIGVTTLALLGAPLAAQPPPKIYHVGIVLLGGPYAAAINGLRDGLRDLGFGEDKQYTLAVRDLKGDLTLAEGVAKTLEADKVDLIYSLATSVTLAVKRATTTVPIVFYAGTDPVAFGLVDSFRKPGGRLTGIYGRFADFTARRLEALKEIVPDLRRVLTLYDPGNPASEQSMRIARDAAQRLKLDLVERRVTSPEQLRAALGALRSGEANAFFYVSDALVAGQTDAIVEAAAAKRLPTMFQDPGAVARGGLASYGVGYHAIGRASAKQVHRVLQGANPRDMPVEELDRIHLVVNLKTAKAIGLTVPPAVLLRADEIIQ